MRVVWSLVRCASGSPAEEPSLGVSEGGPLSDGDEESLAVVLTLVFWFGFALSPACSVATAAFSSLERAAASSCTIGAGASGDGTIGSL